MAKNAEAQTIVARQDYVIEVYRASGATWLGVPSDEDEAGVLPVTTDPAMADRYTDHDDACRAVTAAVKRYPQTAFRLGVLPQLVEEPA